LILENLVPAYFSEAVKRVCWCCFRTSW